MPYQYPTHNHTVESLIAFENRVKALFESGEVPYLVHLSGGNEEDLLWISQSFQKGDWFFSTHRSHYHYLLAGGSEDKLLEMIRTGKSMFVYDRELNFLTTSVLAGLTGAAAGVAASLKEKESPNRVWCFVGDAAEDEGHFYEAVQYVTGHNLPCTFVIEDNNRSCDTTCEQRRGTSWRFPWPPKNVLRYTYEPTYPHGGTGCSQRITFTPQSIKEARYRILKPAFDASYGGIL